MWAWRAGAANSGVRRLMIGGWLIVNVTGLVGLVGLPHVMNWGRVVHDARRSVSAGISRVSVIGARRIRRNVVWPRGVGDGGVRAHDLDGCSHDGKAGDLHGATVTAIGAAAVTALPGRGLSS
jgi:hypothetical protein